MSRSLRELRVRFGVRDESGRARAAVSPSEEEGRRVPCVLAPPPERPRMLDELRALVRR
ncbi:MAG TPA: hypothetical protein VNJ46_08390 [Gaiellaceae bacterium]|nr:hypothetical protein [Gaiellaceae bacterium]